jgi:hypothetical protein
MKSIRPSLAAVLILGAVPLFSGPPASSPAQEVPSAPAPAAPASAPAAPAPVPAATTPAASAPTPAPTTPAAGKKIAKGRGAPAAPVPPVIPVNPRFKQVRDKIATLFHTDTPLSPVADPKNDPFRTESSGAPATPGVADDAGLAAGRGAQASPEPRQGSPNELLKREVMGLKVGGVSVLNGVARISVNGTPHKQGDFIKAGTPASPVWLEIESITPTSVTFRLRDAGPEGPAYTERF